MPCKGELRNTQRRQTEVIIFSMRINHKYLKSFWLSQENFFKFSKISLSTEIATELFPLLVL